MITTVSPRYAEEIQTPEFGFGFDGILRARARRSGRHPERHRHATSGIRRAIRFLPAPFDADDLAGKAAAKAAVLRALRPAGRRRGAARGRSSA